MYNKTNKKKLELKKTAIANLTLSEAQMGIILGGGGETKVSQKTIIDGCTTQQGTIIETDGCIGNKTN
jgi:hypothetical protein